MNGLYFPNSTWQENNELKDNNKNEIRDFNDNYLENILKNNKSKKIKVYCSFPNNDNKLFEGILEDLGNDYLIISEPSTGKWNIIMTNYLNYIEFEEHISI